MPQLNPEFFVSQLFWLAVFFTFLLVFLWRISLPRIATVMEKRQNKIDENLSSTKELQEQALEIEKKINNQINNAKQEADDQIKKTVLSLQNDLTSELLNLDKKLEEKISNSEKEIVKNRDEQMNNISDEIVKITKITIAKISELKVSDNDIIETIKKHKGTLN